MNIDKQVLKKKAIAASEGEWVKESGDGWEAISSTDDQANAGFIIAHFEGADSKENREFVQAANPVAVLALLDELEAAEKRISELEASHSKLREGMATIHNVIREAGVYASPVHIMSYAKRAHEESAVSST